MGTLFLSSIFAFDQRQCLGNMQESEIYIFPPAHLRIVSLRGTDDGMNFRINNDDGPSIYTPFGISVLIISRT